MIKPDGVKRGLTGEILRRLNNGVEIVGIRMLKPSKEQIDAHYPKDEIWLCRIGNGTTKTCETWDDVQGIGQMTTCYRKNCQAQDRSI